jgi:ABC-type transporter Mla subunit MlaD
MSAVTRLVGRGRARARGRAAGKQRSRGFILTVGFVCVAIALGMFYVGYNAPQSVPGRSYYTLHVLMKNADNLQDHYDVRIGGLLAGQVLSTTVRNHLADVELQLSSAFEPLRSDSRIEIRLRSAIGVRYVQIIPGTHGAALRSGATIPASQTSSPVDLDQVLATFDPQARARTQDLLGELGTGVAGQGQAVNNVLGSAPGFLASLGSVSAAINARPGAMHAFISSSQGAAAAFDPVRANLANGLRPEAQALAPFANQANNVQATLEQAPPTLSELDSGLPAVTALVAQVQGLAHVATPTLAAAPTALHETTALLREAGPDLRSANATLHLAQRAVSPTLSFLQTTQPAFPPINHALASALPVVRYVAPRSCGLSDAFTGWSEIMKYGTAYDNFIRFTITETSTIVTGQPGAPSLSTPYPAPCQGSVGEAGGPRQTPEQEVASR